MTGGKGTGHPRVLTGDVCQTHAARGHRLAAAATHEHPAAVRRRPALRVRIDLGQRVGRGQQRVEIAGLAIGSLL